MFYDPKDKVPNEKIELFKFSITGDFCLCVKMLMQLAEPVYIVIVQQYEAVSNAVNMPIDSLLVDEVKKRSSR